MLLLIVLSVLLLAVAIFALENAQAVTVRFLFWQLQSSVAVVTLAATTAGVLIAGLFRVVSRLRRWKCGRAAPGAPGPATLPFEPRSPAGLARRDPPGSRSGQRSTGQAGGRRPDSGSTEILTCRTLCAVRAARYASVISNGDL